MTEPRRHKNCRFENNQQGTLFLNHLAASYFLADECNESNRRHVFGGASRLSADGVAARGLILLVDVVTFSLFLDLLFALLLLLLFLLQPLVTALLALTLHHQFGNHGLFLFFCVVVLVGLSFYFCEASVFVEDDREHVEVLDGVILLSCSSF